LGAARHYWNRAVGRAVVQEFPLSAEQTALCRQMASLAGLGGFIIGVTDSRSLW
jgi:hypothetical protein